jgi:hypothetical protein
MKPTKGVIMFERKITQKRLHEIADEMKSELDVLINQAIEDRHKTDDPRKIDDLYIYQHALEHSRMNINTLVYRLDVNTYK